MRSREKYAINLIHRFYEFDGGRILRDGVDARESTLASLRKQIEIALQDDVEKPMEAVGREALTEPS